MAADIEALSNQKRGRTRSPAYPYLDLPNALEKAAVLWQIEGRHAAAVNVAMQHWGYKEESSTGYSCVAALKKFGLVDHEGMGDSRQVKLSDLALTILLDKDLESEDRQEALRTAALSPRIHAELWDRYGTELPSDQSLKRYLVLERGFNEASVDEFLAEYKQTMVFAGMNVGTGAAGLVPARGPLPVARPRLETAPTNHGRNGAGTTGGTGERRLESAPMAFRTPPRPASAANRVDSGLGRQRGLFEDEEEETEGTVPVRGEASVASSSEPRRMAEIETMLPGHFALAHKELPVPLDHDRVARVPYPMSEEDFELLIGTLQLWKRRLVQQPTGT